MLRLLRWRFDFCEFSPGIHSIRKLVRLAFSVKILAFEFSNETVKAPSIDYFLQFREGEGHKRRLPRAFKEAQASAA